MACVDLCGIFLLIFKFSWNLFGIQLTFCKGYFEYIYCLKLNLVSLIMLLLEPVLDTDDPQNSAYNIVSYASM